jgi:hypothetical protein
MILAKKFGIELPDSQKKIIQYRTICHAQNVDTQIKSNSLTSNPPPSTIYEDEDREHKPPGNKRKR